MLSGEFAIDKDYIKLQIPNNLRNTWVFERVADIFYATISDETNTGKTIKQYYSDIEYYMTDFTKLSLEMKLQKLADNGYSYLVEVFGDDNETLNNLANFLVLIKVLKGRVEGFKLILDTFNFQYKLTTWEEPEYKDEIFTANLKITLASDQLQLSRDLAEKIQKIARNYLAPLLNIEYTVVEELLDKGQAFNNYFSAGYVRLQKFPQMEISRSL